VCADGLLRRCIPAFETWKILEHYHSSPYGGHYGAFRTIAKVWQSGFYWPTMYDDAKSFVSMLHPMSEAQKYQYKGRNATDFESPD
jgi:hypothetical protein